MPTESCRAVRGAGIDADRIHSASRAPKARCHVARVGGAAIRALQRRSVICARRVINAGGTATQFALGFFPRAF